jgi:hypothetical protein
MRRLAVVIFRRFGVIRVSLISAMAASFYLLRRPHVIMCSVCDACGARGAIKIIEKFQHRGGSQRGKNFRNEICLFLCFPRSHRGHFDISNK